MARLLSRDDVRLVTLTGAGGTGKTRLSLRVAGEVLDSFSSGACFVDLSHVRDQSTVATTTLRALGVDRPSTNDAKAEVVRWLGAREVLLVFDNFEQVIEAAVLLPAILASCAGVKIIATSRERLRVDGEWEYPVLPLEMPNPTQLLPYEQLSQYTAVELFVQRARAAQPSFELGKSNGAAVAEICHRLDGIPLAIELAAARVRHLPPEMLLLRLEKRLSVLIGGPRDRPSRQQTMSACIAWSYDLLSEPEQLLFRQLSVFVGGWTLKAAEAVVTYAQGPGRDVLSGISILLDQSLIVRDDEGTGSDQRFRMLETIREFGVDQRAYSSDAASVADDHARYFQGVLSQINELARGDKVSFVAGRKWFEIERGNLEAAQSWTCQSFPNRLHLTSSAMLLAADGAFVLHYLMSAAERQKWWLCAVNAARLLGDTLAEGRALSQLAVAQREDGQIALAMESATRAIELVSGCDDPRIEARAHGEMGNLYANGGDFDRAAAHYVAAERLLEGCEDRRSVAVASLNIGNLSIYRGEFSMAIHRMESVLSKVADLPLESGNILASLGYAYAASGDHESALRCFHAHLEIAVALGDQRGIAVTLMNLAGSQIESGDLDASAESSRLAIQAARNCGFSRVEAHSLGNLARVELARGQAVAAIQTLRNAITLMVAVGDRAAEAEARYHLGLALEITGERDAAKYEIELALPRLIELRRPEADLARAALARLE